MIARVNKVFRNQGKSGKTYFTVAFDNGLKANTFDNNIRAAEGKVIDCQITESGPDGRFKNVADGWSYVDNVGQAPVSNNTSPVQTDRDTNILRQSSLKSAIEFMKIPGVVESFSAKVKKDPAALEAYAQDLAVRWFHWQVDGNWELSDADQFLNNEEKTE